MNILCNGTSLSFISTSRGLTVGSRNLCVSQDVARVRAVSILFQFILIGLISCALSGCLGTVWSGASLIYDRHTVYAQLSDFDLASKAQHVLFDDSVLQESGCHLEVSVMNGDILLAGHVPSKSFRNMADERLNRLEGYRTIFIQVAINKDNPNSIVDSWITSKIRSKIFADSTIAPKDFKIVTVDGIVYIMGDVRADQAAKVVDIARNTDQVVRVVKLFRALTESKS